MIPLKQFSPSKKRTRGNRTQPLQKKNATTMDAIKHTYDTESDAYVVPRELMIEIMEKLKEENKKWESWASEVIHWSHSSSLDNLQAKKLITDDNQPTIASVRDFGKEIKELKKENEKLKKQNASWLEYKNVAEQDIDNMRNILGKELAWHECLKEAQRLKEENEELKSDAENSKAFWECFMDCKGNPDNPTKAEMIQWCDDNNKSDEIREYITEYADDSDSDDEECGVDGFRCEQCEECNRTRVCDMCECVGGCYEHCEYLK